MKISQLSRNFFGPAYGLVVAFALAACSSSGDEPSDPPTGGTGSSTGGSAGNTSSSTGGTTSSGGNTPSGGTGTGATSGTDELVGSFQVQVTVDDEDPTTGTTSVIGKVSDAPTPQAVVWEVAREEGDCQLEKPRVPFCDPKCGADICAEDDTCVPYPAGVNVGDVSLSGVAVTGGSTELPLREISKNYQPLAGTTFAYPPFSEGDAVRLVASGGQYGAFDLEVAAVRPLTLTGGALAIELGTPLELSWDAAADPEASTMHVKLDISHHGGTRGMIECDAADTGSLTIPAALLSDLIDLGVAGFPTVVVTRIAATTAPISIGRVELSVSSKVEQVVDVPGVESCTGDVDCAEGKTCQSDLTCQ